MTDPKDLLIAFDAKSLDVVCNALARVPLPWIETNPILVDITAQVNELRKQKAPEGALPVIDTGEGAPAH